MDIYTAETIGVSDSVAKIINSGMRAKIIDDMAKSVTDKYRHPRKLSEYEGARD